MIPLSSAFCVTCGSRYESMPVYYSRRVVHPRDGERACPGPLLRFTADEPAPPVESEATA